MLKKLVNEANFALRITTTGPLLIKSGQPTLSGPDMTPVLTFRNGQYEVFLPGSSLKGVFRSYLEKIVCSLRSRVVCYPFSGGKETEADISQRQRDYRDSCGAMLQKEHASHTVYEKSCPACRLFGSTAFIGRVAISDAYLVSAAAKEQRDGVGIDRLTGGASYGAKFELEVVSTGVTFETDIHLRNFEIWQLGMLFIVIQDMEDELIRIGSGRSRGLGKVTASLSDEGRDGKPGGVEISSIRESAEPDNELWGLGKWLGDDNTYGTWKDDLLALPRSIERVPRGIRTVRTFNGDDLSFLREDAIKDFIKRIRNWPEQPTAIANH